MRHPRKILIGSCLPLLALAHIFDLSELNWTLRNQNGSIVVPGSLPSQAHIDLFKAGIITEPLLGINEHTQQWIANDNWTYTADLTPSGQHYKNDLSDRTLLVFYGIDTVANMTLAGHPVGWVNNQYCRYIYDVSGYIGSAVGNDNNLTIALESANSYILNVTGRQDAEPLPEQLGPYLSADRWIRKISCDFGWDFAPNFVPSGVYKPAFLVTLSESPALLDSLDDPTYPVAKSAILLEETSVDIYKYGQNMSLIDQSADWVLNVTFGIRSIKSYTAPTVTLSIPELGITSQPIALDPIQMGTETTTFMSVTWSISEGIPERWYPFNLGTPKLYNLTIVLHPTGTGHGAVLSDESITQTVTTGFRTIQLMQSPYSEEEVALRGITPGDQWHFEVNGKAFYSKGTGVTPFDPFYARINPDAVRWLLESAVKSGQNMLRVWGGGIYQPSDKATDGGLYDFYSLCDELGILAWSELAFSDNLYPTNSWLLESIEPEVRQNVRRVNRHPSNAQWAAGNEWELIADFVVITVGPPNDTHYVDKIVYYIQDYLHDLVLSETNSVAYTASSSTRGVLSLNPYVLRLSEPGTAGYIYGNFEYYDYDSSQVLNLSAYPVTRFLSEFGFHSMPSFYTWQDILENPEDFAFNSTVVMSRDNHPLGFGSVWPDPNAGIGQYQMSDAVEVWLPTPGTSDANQTFAQWCWSTQVFQSMMMTSEIAWYRRGAGMGENNLGTIVWSLNDIWGGINWAVIDYSGRWKVANYGLASVYASVIIQPFWMAENETLTVLATSDRWETVDGMAQLTWYDWHGHVLNTSTTSFSVPSLNNSLIYEGTGLGMVLPTGHDASDVWLLMNLTAQVDGETVISESYFTPVSLAQANLVDPEIVVNAGDDYTFTLSAQGGVGVWTWLDHPHGTIGYFEDTTTGRPSNGFYLVPGIDRTVRFIQNAKLSSVQNPDPTEFVVRSLWNNTHV